MTPDKRLNQIEPVLADVVQKVDRLIEGNGQIIHEVSKIPGIERTVLITAKGLADLTISVNQRFNSVDERFNSVDEHFDQFQQEVNQQFEGVNQRFGQLQHEVNQRFDQLQQEVSDVKSGQQLILQILREKLP